MRIFYFIFSDFAKKMPLSKFCKKNKNTWFCAIHFISNDFDTDYRSDITNITPLGSFSELLLLPEALKAKCSPNGGMLFIKAKVAKAHFTRAIKKLLSLIFPSFC
jgi:hypothetical protein